MRDRPPRGTEQRERGERSERHVYGVNPVLEALRVRADEVERLYITEGQLGSKAAAEILSRARDAGIRVERVPRERLASLAEGGVHQGVVAELRGFQYAELEDLLEAAEASGRPRSSWCWTASRIHTTWGPSSARRMRWEPTASSWARTGRCR